MPRRLDTPEDGAEALKLLARGAEAELYLVEWGGRLAVLKRRVPKPYRHRVIDDALRFRRTLVEARMLVRALELGLSVPLLYEVRLSDAEIIMEYVEGRSLRWYIEECGLDEVAVDAVKRLGWMIGVLHEHGFVHGDVTTSNIIVTGRGSYKLIDFGLSGSSDDEEDKAVDVHLFLRAVESTHPEYADSLYKLFLEGYGEARGREKAEMVAGLVSKIRLMGRYVEERRRRRMVWEGLH
ncbi:Kae1-associated kinase Bud32 [Pyrolobus fumarii]|uniref:Kae1-associated kinase Bud32 n=1 Tax=Pyrolobus fumarii TaxID=54252 RepID=UPI0009FCFC53|nr:Kae1-associated kinase Bud32 [Pyrolobus fumarii]